MVSGSRNEEEDAEDKQEEEADDDVDDDDDEKIAPSVCLLPSEDSPLNSAAGLSSEAIRATERPLRF